MIALVAVFACAHSSPLGINATEDLDGNPCNSSKEVTDCAGADTELDIAWVVAVLGSLVILTCVICLCIKCKGS